jgi:hypothetical protein
MAWKRQNAAAARHDAIDRQIRDVEQPFDVAGAKR